MDPGRFADAGTYIELAAESQQVEEVRFAALDRNGRHRAQVRMLEGPLNRLSYQAPARSPSVEAAHDGPSAQPAPAAATASSATDSDGKNSPRTGLVMAVPRVVKVADVDAVTNFIWISGWALLGVIVYSPSRKKITTAWRGPGSANSRRDNSADRQVEVTA